MNLLLCFTKYVVVFSKYCVAFAVVVHRSPGYMSSICSTPMLPLFEDEPNIVWCIKFIVHKSETLGH